MEGYELQREDMKNTERSYEHLTLFERDRLYMMRSEGKKLQEIGDALGRSRSTISRDLKRNRHKDEEVELKSSFRDRARYAHDLALERRKIVRKREKILCDKELELYIVNALRFSDKSPRDISYGVKEDFVSKSVCHGTIYNFINRHKRVDLKECLRQRGKKFKTHITPPKRGSKKGTLKKKKSIHEMPSYARSGLTFGHLQIDGILSRKNGSGQGILSIKDIFTHYAWYFKIADLKSETVLSTLTGFLRTFVPGMIQTILVDNGSEFEHLFLLEAQFPGLLAYYCDPYSPHQRGLNEYSNRELRWYYPKGTDFGDIPNKDIWQAQDKINLRRRPCLKGKTAKQLLEQALIKGPSRLELVDSKKSLEWNPCMIDLSSLFEKKQDHLLGWKQTEGGLCYQQNSDLFLPSLNLSDCNSFYSQNIGIGLH